MKRLKTNALISILVVTSFITTTTVTDSIEAYARNYVSQNVKLTQSKSYNKKISHDTRHADGLKPLTKKDKQWLKENAVDTKDVALNKIGLKRINQVRAKKGIKTIDSDKAVKVGNEVISQNSPKAVASAATSDTSNLPESVDNSELPYFPAISSQGRLGCCAAFATTYYEATYMNAMAKNWNIRDNPDDSKIFSVKWTYDLLNSARDEGVSQTAAYELFKDHGIATQKDFPFTGKPGDYLEWPTNPEVWKDASQNRLDKMGYVDIGDTATPIENEKSPNLTKIKKLLNDGYILNCGASVCENAGERQIKDNPNSHSDDNYVGEKAIYENTSVPNHEMTVVGYNDDIWVDMNENGKIDDGEKGAFKIANSWGNDYENNGFVWLSYDALNRVSAVKNGAPTYYSGDSLISRSSFVESNRFYWMTMKPSYTPKLLVQADINSAHRGDLRYELGYSDLTEKEPKITWLPVYLNDGAGGLNVSKNCDYSFNGTTTASDGTIVIDYSNFLPSDISKTKKRWYLRITDDSKSAVLKGFRFIDPSVSDVGIDPSSCNYELDSTKADLTNYKLNSPKNISSDKSNPTTITMDYQVSSDDENTSSKQWVYKDNLSKIYDNVHKMLAYNGKIYAVCTEGSETKVLEYDPSLGSWNVLSSDSLPNLDYDMVILNGKIYGFTTSGYSMDSLKKAYVYDISTEKWSEDSTISIPNGIVNYALAALDNKLYLVGGYQKINNEWTPTNTLWEYDPLKKAWTSKANMSASIRDAAVSVAKDASDGKDKIYVLGGITGKYDKTIDNYDTSNQIEKYDPSSDTWSQEGINPYFGWDCYYSNTNDYYYNYGDGDGASVCINDNIYMFLNDSGDVKVYAYDTGSKAWIQKETMPQEEAYGIVSAQALNGEIYALSNNNSILKFNPSASDEKPRVGEPRFSVQGGTYAENQRISISSSTPNAVIKYTTDGTDPTKSSLIYTGPITISGKTTIKAVATEDGYIDSYAASADYDIASKAPAPTFSLASGNYKFGQTFTINSNIPGAVIKYTTNGVNPSASSRTYTDPIGINGKMQVKAIVMKKGYAASDVAQANYKAPDLIGDVNGDGEVNYEDYTIITKYASGEITDFPNIDDDMWAGDVNGDGKIDSADAAILKDYIDGKIDYFPKERPSVPTGLTVTSTTSTSITLSWQASTGMNSVNDYYVYRDGTFIGEVSDNSFTDKTVTEHTKYSYTVQAIDSKENTSDKSSALVVSTDSTQCKPKFSIPSGAYKYMQKLSISCDIPGAVIRYTTDGTDPTASSPIYTDPITLHDKMTVKAVEMKDGVANSDIITENYTAPSLVGDVNGDGKIDILDLILIQRYATGKITDFPNIDDDMWAGDVNGDGKIDSTDVSLVKSYIQHNIGHFPKELPVTPGNLSVSSSTTSSITLSWTASTAVGAATIDHYEIYRNGTLLNDKIATNNYADSTVAANTKYSYTVVAVDSEGRKSAVSKAFVVSTDGIG